MTYSEFGRPQKGNSRRTDHGAGRACSLPASAAWSGSTRSTTWIPAIWHHTVSAGHATLLDQWLGIDSAAVSANSRSCR